jgi:serine protease AprX
MNQTEARFLILSIITVLLMYPCLPTWKASVRQNAILKTINASNEYKTTFLGFAANDTILLWLDLYVKPLQDRNIYLHSNDLLGITDIGAKIAGVTFSPDGQLLWFLIETRADSVPSLVSLPGVKNVSLASSGTWKWWDRSWRDATRIDPILNFTIQRVMENSPSTRIPIVINYKLDEGNRTMKDKQKIVNDLKAIACSAAGSVEDVGIPEYVGAAQYLVIKAQPTIINLLLNNTHVISLEAVRPVLIPDGPSSKTTSEDGTPTYTFLAFLCPACCLRNSRKSRTMILVLLLVFTSFLLMYNVPIGYSLAISRGTINADKVNVTGNGTVVAVVDTGVDFNHTYLKSAIKRNVDLSGANDSMDYVGHGTIVAGIIASREPPGGCRGIAPGCGIVNLKIGPPVLTLIQKAIQWCITNGSALGIRVINLSIGDDVAHPNSNGTDPLSMVADEAVEAGMSVVVAAYDKDNKPPLSSPDQAYDVITVGAIMDKRTSNITDDELWVKSGRGPAAGNRTKPDVVAPGGHVDAYRGGIWSLRSGSATRDHFEDCGDLEATYGRGTSFAAPHVSGTIALMLEANPNLTPAQVKAILKQTARLNDNLKQLTVNDRGQGIIDAYAAVQLAQHVSAINISQMYDSWVVSTPNRDLGWGYYDYMTFNVGLPSTFGVSVQAVDYHYRWLGTSLEDYQHCQNISVRDVWIDSVYHNLGTNMSRYLFSGPRVYETGSGYVKMRAWFQIGTIRLMWYCYISVDAIDFGIQYSGGSSWKTLVYMNPCLWNGPNIAYLPSTSETVLIERRIVGHQLIDIRCLGHSEYIQVDQCCGGDITMWTLLNTYSGNNPDERTALNGEFIYDRNIAVCFQSDSQFAYTTLWRKSDALPLPNSTQNDAESGGDAGNTFATATPISPGLHRGILCWLDPVDEDDYYSFPVYYGSRIYVAMAPPPQINFGLGLLDPTGSLKGNSTRGPGQVESISCRCNFSGYWRLRIHLITGEAQYSFYLSIDKGPCAMKTLVDGFFYIPSFGVDTCRIELLWNATRLAGDQIGGTSPYPSIAYWPDGVVDVSDVSFETGHFGTFENGPRWSYLADVVASGDSSRIVDVEDVARAVNNFGQWGSLSADLTGVTVHFSNGQVVEPDSSGYVSIPQGQGISGLSVCRNGQTIGAVVTFWGH